jgi:hypothetical protein
MKRSILLAAMAAAAALPARAQTYPTDRGSLLLGGSASLSATVFTQEVDGARERDAVAGASLNPDVQYFVRPGLAVGGELGLATDFEGAGAVSVGPRVSYYFGRGERRVYPYVSGGVSHVRAFGGDRLTALTARTGGVFMFSRQVGLNAGLVYTGFSADDEPGTERVDAFALALGFTAFTF